MKQGRSVWALRAGGWGREPCPLGRGQPGQERRTEAMLGREAGSVSLLAYPKPLLPQM